MSEPFILCDGLVKIYQIADLEVVALQGLNLSVRSGELMAIVGVSGSGKSTLMNILGGLDRPTAGQVRVGDFNLLKMSERAINRYRREQVGFVWQQSARNLVPYLNAIENVELPMTLAGFAGKEKRKRAQDLLEKVGLSERMKHHMRELSGGEQQRVAIAISLANSPALLLADEPTGEVDSTTALNIYATLRTLNEEMGLTTIIVSHDPTIARHVDRVVAIRDGMLASETRRQMRTVERFDEDALNSGGDGIIEEHEEHFEELVVLDSAGRLQIPKDVLQQFSIRGRALLEITDEGILIRPVENENAAAPELIAQEQAAVSHVRQANVLGEFFTRFRRKKRS